MNKQLSGISALSSISTQYRKFSKGQYIEHTQFNEFLDFFEDQDRLSRVMLQGVGIVCGLKPNLTYANKLLSSIQLSQGAALTTDGDLLTLNTTSEVSKDLYVSDLKTINIESKNYTHFKAYDNFKVGYPAFYENNGRGEQVELWELATAQEAHSDFQPIRNLSNIEEKYLLLYLENYEKEVKPCKGVDCDNHGVQQIRNLKVLVTTTKGIANILGDDFLPMPDPVDGTIPPKIKDLIQPHPLFIEDVLRPDKQERVIVDHLIVNNGVEKKISSADLKDLYITALEKNNYGEFVFEKINKISEIIGGQGVNHAMFKNVLQQCLDQQFGFQYAYDVVKDLMETYSEIIKLLPKSFTKDFPDLSSFPKHIMLGKLASGILLDSFRHQFYNSPVLDDQKAAQRVKVLVNRFVLQTQNFRYSTSFEEAAKIKIIPSQKLNPLSNKAIPFYYQSTKDLLKTWNFDKTGNRSYQDNLGYGIDFFSPNTQISDDPLHFNIDKNSFYNIEGHQGMLYEEAFQQIKEIKDKQQLGFDVMVLSLGELVDNKDLFKAYFNDYVAEHSGLEHKRGVERGGTFIMVYETIGRDARVIADFSLPYICCTPKIDIKLSLPGTVICAEADHLPFTVIPVNGEVKAVVDTVLNGGVEMFNGKYFFNPQKVDKSLHDKEITFTVNGKPTNCSIKVISEPKVNIVAASVVYPDGNSGEVTVNFTVSGQNFTDYNYSWDFWDNGGWVTLKPNARGFVSYTFHNLIPTRIPTIRVQVDGGGCSQDIAISDWYEAQVQLSLPKEKDVICSESALTPFEVSPADGEVKAVVNTSLNGGVEMLNGKYFFNPKKVDKSLHGQVIHFTVNGQSTNCSIKVITQPAVTVVVKSVDYPSGSSNETVIHFKVSQQIGQDFMNYDYSWNFGDYGNQSPVNPDSDGNVICKLYNVNPKNIPVIKVMVSNGDCNQTISLSNWYDPPSVPTVVINSIKFPKGNCCEDIPSAVLAEVEGDKNVSASQGSFTLQGKGSGALNLDYSWFQTYSDNGKTLVLDVSNEEIVKVTGLYTGSYEFQFMVIDADTGVFDAKTVKVNISR
ncbi:hypothetical protein IW15_17065 [Chryseobacterium soli]|uniref:PKD domain-containing protein n=1 Tax=Chryseobacterium soli TaxID=445961 RepID=A0A086A2H3_9FLAO|nr:hypothetical protein [Chryseobacterium soli]KFF10887.1 hypothetical protein IW15_17065 [Chryseobacterium soli]